MRWDNPSIIGILLTMALSIGCSESADCLDNDLDDLGANCSSGADCDDTNPLRTDNCDTVEPPNCMQSPTATGCPCLTGTSSDCYQGPEGTEGVGLCEHGRSICTNGYWGLCLNAITPVEETCNTEDDNCDGIVDDGVLSPCGGCTTDCTGGVWGQAEAPFVSNDTLTTTSHGWLTLKKQPPVTTALWIANTGEDTVSKIDLSTATEVARYHSHGDEPIRIAVDYNGDAWVVNRAYTGQSSLTKIAGELSHCVDRNDNGIDTSNGPGDVLPPGEDECILLSVPLGSDDPPAVGRALAIDGSSNEDATYGGSVWVGLHTMMQVQERDGQTGALIRTVQTPDFAPYAAAFDAWGRLWLISQDGILARIDRSQSQPEATFLEAPLSCYLLYGLTLDTNEDLLMSGFHCDQVVHYNPDTQVWRNLATYPSARGLAVIDSTAWVAHTDGHLSQVDMASFTVTEVHSLTGLSAQPFESIGVATSNDMQVWVVSSQNLLGSNGVVTQLNASDGSIVSQTPVGLAPHTQGDLTGSERPGAFVPEGVASHVFDGCDDDHITEWHTLHLSADSGTSGSVRVAIRRASAQDDLPNQDFIEVGTFSEDFFSIPIDVPNNGVLEVQITLRTSARDGAPRVKLVGIEWACRNEGIF